MKKKFLQVIEILKTYRLYILATILSFFIGAFLFFINRNWLVISWIPGYSRSENAASILRLKVCAKKKLPCYYWNDGVIKKQNTSVVFRSNPAEILQLLISNWLVLLYEERILEKTVCVESLSLSSSEQEVYLSFDQSPFLRTWSIEKKWQLFDGLCRTIADSNLGIQTIVFFVNHEPMRDDHLDFSHPWPIDGFGDR